MTATVHQGRLTVGMVSDDDATMPEVPDGPRSDAAVAVPSRSLLEAHDVFIASDNPFQRKARLLQALWREDHGWPCGVDERSGTPLGSRLPMPQGQDESWNFLTPTIGQIARDEVLGPDRDPQAVYQRPRIFNDLLSSQPLCFNLFGELRADLGLATLVFADLFGDVGSVTCIRFEWSPGRGDDRYLGNRSAFDVFVEYESVRSDRGFIGIEVKYHENLRVRPASHKTLYDECAAQAGCFAPAGLDAFVAHHSSSYG